MIVTNEQGRYLEPDLPKAKYMVWVWVCGCGLAESSKAEAARGGQLNLKAVPAANAVSAPPRPLRWRGS